MIYIVSTTILIGIGEWFYYKISYKNIIENEIKSIETEIRLFLEQNKGMVLKIIEHKLRPKNLKIAIYKNGKLIFSDLNCKKIHLNRKFWIKNGYLYYRYETLKRWGKVEIIAQKMLDKEKLVFLKRSLLAFNVFFLVFLTFISFWLGRVFLAPMKEVINNLEDFIRDSTHEMNTPLSTILTNIEILKEKPSKKAIERIEKASLRLNKIFDDLKYIKLHHKKKRDLKKINLKDFINKRITLFETQIEGKNLKIIKDCDNTETIFDEEDLIRLMDNLLSNAIKYAPCNSTITIRLKNGEFCIKNDGEIKNIKNITKKFTREEKVKGGFGLGLYIVKEITKEYKIKFEIKNIEGKVIVRLCFV
ncbi:sensor histidine kinase [Hippea sp. KM1]|uniref:sensor histidine kinase n=1 Tax=Hippea sp. KM1 TaxID=944481 RepID=UPI0012EBEF75|nr:HAMP domain-containing sensor histidine kinase [Hippea sp. KM1]